MFSMILALVFSAIAIFFSFLACFYAKKYSAASVSVRRLSKLQAEMTEMTDSLASLHQMLRKLRSRIGMREVRARRKASESELEEDLSTESGRTAARNRLESELARSGKLNARYHLGGNNR